MPIVIARKRIYRTAAGGELRVTKEEAAVLKALQLADDPPPVVAEPPKRVYKRRDLVAESPTPEPVPQRLPAPPTPVPEPAPKPVAAAPLPARKPAPKPTFTDET